MIYYDSLFRVEQQYVQFYGRQFTICSIQAVLIQYGQYRSNDMFGTLSLFWYDLKKKTSTCFWIHYLYSFYLYIHIIRMPVKIYRYTAASHMYYSYHFSLLTRCLPPIIRFSSSCFLFAPIWINIHKIKSELPAGKNRLNKNRLDAMRHYTELKPGKNGKNESYIDQKQKPEKWSFE